MRFGWIASGANEGIDDATVASAPRVEGVLPAFLEFAAGAVLVAHNAGFDVGFLKAACARAERAWPGFPVVDTVRLARHVLTKEEARDVLVKRSMCVTSSALLVLRKVTVCMNGT